MPNTDLPQILVVAGDYDIVYHVQQALQGERLSLQRAFTHRDALYLLEHAKFDLAIADAAMYDRYTGEQTLTAVVRFSKNIPLIAFDLNDSLNDDSPSVIESVVKELDKQVILHTIQDALHLLNKPVQVTRDLGTPTNDALASRIDEIQTLFALSRSLTEVLDLNEVLNRVVEAARRLTNAEEGMILLPDDEAGQLFLRAKVGFDVEVARNFRIRTQDTLAGQVFQSGQPTLVGDQGPQKVKTEYFVNSLVYVPILLQGQPIGVLGVNNKDKADVFDKNHQELLMSLSSYAAIAIENARIHEESLQRARDLETLVDVSQILNSSLSLEETLDSICTQIVQVLGVNRAEVFQLDADANQLQALARVQRATWRFGQGPNIPLGRQPSLQKAVKQNRPLWLKRTDNVSPAEAEMFEKAAAGVILMIPIYSQEKLLGLLRAFYIEVDTNPPSMEAIQSSIHTGVEGLAMILSQPDQTRVGNVSRLLETVNRQLNSDWCDVSSPAENDTLTVHTEVGGGVWLHAPYPTIDLSKCPEVMQAVQGQTLIQQQGDTTTLSGPEKMLREMTASRSILGLPFTQRRQPPGLILVGNTERNRNFSKREVDMCRTIAGQAATALENAHLVHDLELSLQELKDTQARLVETARLSAMGELAAVVAHQINNPLTTIVIDTEMMMQDEPQGSRNFNTMEAVLRAGRRAAGVAKRLLAVSRPNDPESPTEPIDVVDTIRGVLSLIQTHIERDKIRVLPTLPEENMPRVEAVRGHLDDVWLNLMMNAHDALFGRRDAELGIELAHNDQTDMIEVMVWDNGPGIPEHIQTAIFNPFFTTKPVGEGTGLGLHICRQVVERVGGKIWVESQPGQGTRFYVHLPVNR